MQKIKLASFKVLVNFEELKRNNEERERIKKIIKSLKLKVVK